MGLGFPEAPSPGAASVRHAVVIVQGCCNYSDNGCQKNWFCAGQMGLIDVVVVTFPPNAGFGRTKPKRAPPPNPRARHRPRSPPPVRPSSPLALINGANFDAESPLGGRRTDPLRTKGCDGTGPPAAARSPSGDARTALRCPSLGRRHASGDRLWQFGNACELMFCCA